MRVSDEDLKYLKLLQIKHNNDNLLKNWIQEYSNNTKDPLYKLIMEVLNKSNPDELMEVYKNMGIPKISEANKAFLMESIKDLGIDKELEEKARREGELQGELKGELRGELRGKLRGKTEGKSEMLIKQLMKKFKKLPEEYKIKIRELPQETIELIGIDIFDLNSVDELEQYL